MTPYSYIKASIASNAKKGTNPKSQYRELFQKTLEEQFYNSSNWWTIEEETSVGSALYENIDVRISHVINAETGLKLGDDWKTLMFENVDHEIELGKQYKFDDNTWLVINTEVTKNLTGTCTIRRCNNTLRWINESTGAYYEEPCCIEYLVKEPRDYSTQGSPFMTPGGFIHIETQLNPRTNLIKQNQRFLFGNPEHWTCYKIIGTGVNDFKNVNTYDNESAKILTLDLIANFVNDELDDIVDGVADVYTNTYTITLNKNSASGSPLNTVQLIADVVYNGKSTTRDIDWETSNSKIATVSTSGLVSLVASGSCAITATIEDNPVSGSCLITVGGSPVVNSEIRITPLQNYILEGSTQAYTAYLYENDIVQADAITVTCSENSVPATSYTFSQTGANAFSISNILRDVSSYLTIQCVSGL